MWRKGGQFHLSGVEGRILKLYPIKHLEKKSEGGRTIIATDWIVKYFFNLASATNKATFNLVKLKN
jgi:hypothetical protein